MITDLVPDLKWILMFTLDDHRYGVGLSAVERVVQAVEITLLPKAPEAILGVINVHGLVVPVVDIRWRLGLPRREVAVDDLFILAHTARQLVALAVDTVDGAHHLPDNALVTAEEITAGTQFIHGLAKIGEDLILICDLDQFLALDDVEKLAQVLPIMPLPSAPDMHLQTPETM